MRFFYRIALLALLLCSCLLGLAEEEEYPFLAEGRRLGELYRDIYAQVVNDGGEAALSQQTKDTIERILIESGAPVMDSDAVYPDHLANSQGVYAFMEDARAGMDTQTAFWRVTDAGGLSYTQFVRVDGEQIYIHAICEWTEAGALAIADMDVREINYLALTQSGDLLYQAVQPDRHWDAAQLVRLHGVDPALYDLYLKYIAPVGYDASKLFTTDWSADDYGALNFNSLLDGLYFADNGSYFDASAYPFVEEPAPHRAIPAALFERSVLAHFDMPLTEFRESALYDAETDSYPCQGASYSENIYTPATIAEPVDCSRLDEHTFTLRINVLCPDAHLDSAFAHELTIRLLDGGGYQYLENRVYGAARM